MKNICNSSQLFQDRIGNKSALIWSIPRTSTKTHAFFYSGTDHLESSVSWIRCFINAFKKNCCHFPSRHPTGGSFIRPNKANFGIDFLSAVKKKYGLNENEHDPESETALSLVIGKKTVETVGFDSIKEKLKQVQFPWKWAVPECLNIFRYY